MNSDYMHAYCNTYLLSRQGWSHLPIVIDCTHMAKADFTAAKAIQAMLEDFSSRDQAVYWMYPSQGLLNTLLPVVGDLLRVISVPEEVVQKRPGHGSITTGHGSITTGHGSITTSHGSITTGKRSTTGSSNTCQPVLGCLARVEENTRLENEKHTIREDGIHLVT